MEHRDLAKLLVMELRKYMREKTPHNDITPVPVLELLTAGATPGMKGTSKDLEAAMRILRDAKICQISMQQVGPGLMAMLQMTPDGRDLTDEQIVARLFPERN